MTGRPLQDRRDTPRDARLAAFAAPAMPMAVTNLSLAVYLPQFYATQSGIGLAVIGFVFMAVRLADLVFDPLLGIAIDRTSTSIGRFRPWMLAGIPVAMIGSWLAFFPPQEVGVAYLVGALSGVFVGYSLITVTQFSWAAVLGEDSNARSRAYGAIQGAATLGMLLIMALLPLVAAYLPGGKDLTVPAIGLFIIITTPLTVMVATTRVAEPQRAALAHVPSFGRAVLDYGKALACPPVARVMASTVFTALASGVTSALFLFFAPLKGFTAAQANLLLLIYFVGAFASSRAWAPTAFRFGKEKVLIAICLTVAAVKLTVLALPNGAFYWASAGQVVLGACYSGTMIMLKSIVGDAADYAKQRLDEDFTGRLYAVYSSLTKASIAVSVGVIFFVLQAIGYAPKAGSSNSPEALQNLELSFVLIPAALFVAGALAIARYGRTSHPDPAASVRREVQP
ncbi:MFS transporter [Phenylobacterium sp.]|uniref:MFS transporter n=1 Tax=Phenylobacterium sp. TaxID=1871053 RepID=UPI00301DBA85